MSCGVGLRPGSDPTLLWLWCRPAATASIGPLAWEPPYASGVALEKGKKTKQKKKKKRERENGKYLENTYTDQSDPGDREKLKTREKRKEGVKFLKR